MITYQVASEYFSYNPNTGVITNKVDRHYQSKAGEPVGAKETTGYIRARFKGTTYHLHRLAWLLHYGHWPSGQIDHINGIRDDNRIHNLRDIPQAENKKNLRLRKDNLSGIPGVSWCKRDQGWITTIGKQNLGFKKDFFEACCSRKSAELTHNYHENHGRN